MEEHPLRTLPAAKPALCLQDVFRKTALKAITQRLKAAISTANEATARETDGLFKEQAELGHRQQQLVQGLQALQV